MWRKQSEAFLVFLINKFFQFRSLRVVVEDKQSSGGAFTMKVSPSATIERLKQEVMFDLWKNYNLKHFTRGEWFFLNIVARWAFEAFLKPVLLIDK